MLYGFLLVLARISGVFVFLPLPGLEAGPSAAKITLAMILTFGMYSRWPVLDPIPGSMMQVAGWMLAEAAIGLATGLAVAFLIEAVTFAAQAISTQAGFAYASTIDPNTEADSTVLLILAQLTAGLLFFAMGFDRVVLTILARSLETHPPGAFVASRASVEALVMLGSSIFSTGRPFGASLDDAAVPDRLVHRAVGASQFATAADCFGVSREDADGASGFELSGFVDSQALSTTRRRGFHRTGTDLGAVMRR